MMMNMVNEPEPTRAEVNDVSHAAIMGADCVMLSDETANGKYPIKTVESMKRILLYTQTHIPSHSLANPQYLTSHSGAISSAAVQLAKELHVDAIVAETKTGATAHHLAAYRPLRPIISVTSDPRVAQQLTLLYATKSFLRPDGEKAGLKLAHELVEKGYLPRPATVVLVSGRQPGVEGGELVGEVGDGDHQFQPHAARLAEDFRDGRGLDLERARGRPWSCASSPSALRGVCGCARRARFCLASSSVRPWAEASGCNR
jgi:pyruvate kinase